MSELPMHGDEYFHRETLTVVTVAEFLRGYDAVPDHVNLLVDGEFRGGCEIADFAADYARNEPVTLELLERMGWTITHFEDQVSRGELGFVRLYFRGDRPHLSIADGDGSEGADFPPPATLRDLLVTLRVFGLDAKPVTEAFRKLSDVSGGRWDNVDPEAFVREQRDG